MSDLISKQAVLDLISREETLTAFADYVGSGMSMNDFDALWDIVAKMPAVNPTKTGHWEQYGNSWEDKFKCSECGKEQPKILCGEQIIGHWSDYCPNCGCRMVEPQERSDKE